jgi:hypothetical protein
MWSMIKASVRLLDPPGAWTSFWIWPLQLPRARAEGLQGQNPFWVRVWGFKTWTLIPKTLSFFLRSVSVNQSSFLCILSSSDLYSSFLQTCECVLCGKNGLTAMALQNLIFRFLQSVSHLSFSEHFWTILAPLSWFMALIIQLESLHLHLLTCT